MFPERRTEATKQSTALLFHRRNTDSAISAMPVDLFCENRQIYEITTNKPIFQTFCTSSTVTTEQNKQTKHQTAWTFSADILHRIVWKNQKIYKEVVYRRRILTASLAVMYIYYTKVASYSLKMTNFSNFYATRIWCQNG